MESGARPCNSALFYASALFSLSFLPVTAQNFILQCALFLQAGGTAHTISFTSREYVFYSCSILWHLFEKLLSGQDSGLNFVLELFYRHSASRNRLSAFFEKTAVTFLDEGMAEKEYKQTEML